MPRLSFWDGRVAPIRNIPEGNNYKLGTKYKNNCLVMKTKQLLEGSQNCQDGDGTAWVSLLLKKRHLDRGQDLVHTLCRSCNSE